MGLLAFSDTTTILPDKNIRPLATADRKKNPIRTSLDMFRLVWKRIFFFGENMILPSCKIQYTKTSRKNSKMKKIQKTGFFKESALGFCPPRSKKNPKSTNAIY